MNAIWSLYLDADDASAVLHALEVLERYRAIREPLPLDQPALLLARLRTIARIGAEDAVHWRHEAEDRREEARGDGGRWGSPEGAARMQASAEELADGSARIAAAADAAAADLEPRLDRTAPGDDSLAAATRAAGQALLDRQARGEL